VFTEMKVLDELINEGWGNVPQERIPSDWRKRKPPNENIRKELLEDFEDEVELDAPCVSEEAPSLPRGRYEGLTPARVSALRSGKKMLERRKRRGKWRQREIGKSAAGGRG
jgi:hypothetical protein